MKTLNLIIRRRASNAKVVESHGLNTFGVPDEMDLTGKGL
jgi:hypothetical protein